MKNSKLIRFLVGITATLTVLIGALNTGGDTPPAPATTTTPAATSTIVFGAHEALQEDLAETTTVAPVTTVPETTTVPVLVVNADPSTPCFEWLGLAVVNGWENTPAVLERLGSIIWSESRCIPQIVSATSDHGLAQINATAHRAYVESIYGEPFEAAMSDPGKNLAFAWRLYSELETAGRCGWKPWSIKC